jgi:hypothetical protein
MLPLLDGEPFHHFYLSRQQVVAFGFREIGPTMYCAIGDGRRDPSGFFTAGSLSDGFEALSFCLVFYFLAAGSKGCFSRPS